MWVWTWVGCIWHALSSLPIWRLADNHSWCHLKRHVCPYSRKWAHCMERMVVHLYVKSFIISWSLHDQRGLSFRCWCGVGDPMQKTMPSNVISWPTCVVVELSTIAKFCKYKGFHVGHYFIPMAMEVYSAFMHDMDCFIKECACFFHNRWLGGHLSLSFRIQFFRQHVSIVLQHVLTFVIKRKIVSKGDACFRPLIIIRSHNLHGSNIRRDVGEIASYHEKD